MPSLSINLRFEKLETTRKNLFDQLKTMDDSVLHFRPAAPKWSIAQIIFHLSNSESGSVRYIMKKSQGGSAISKSDFFTSLRSFILTVALRNFKWKKAAVLPDPPENPDVNTLMQSWEETRRQLRQLLDQLPEHMFARNLFRHPFAGRLNMEHTLIFLQEHFDHHLKQINERISLAKKSS